MNNETQQIEKQLDYDDSILSLYSVCQEYGCRRVLLDFRTAFPEMFHELEIQIKRLPDENLPALLK